MQTVLTAIFMMLPGFGLAAITLFTNSAVATPLLLLTNTLYLIGISAALSSSPYFKSLLNHVATHALLVLVGAALVGIAVALPIETLDGTTGWMTAGIGALLALALLWRFWPAWCHAMVATDQSQTGFVDCIRAASNTTTGPVFNLLAATTLLAVLGLPIAAGSLMLAPYLPAHIEWFYALLIAPVANWLLLRMTAATTASGQTIYVNLGFAERRQKRLVEAIRDRNTIEAYALLDQGVHPDLAEDSELVAPLVAAIENDDPGLVKALLRAGANTEKCLALIAVMRSSGAASKTIAQLLIDAGANVAQSDSAGNTPLHAAAFRGDVAAIQLLLLADADLEAQNQQRFTPLAIAVSQRRWKAAQYLLDKGAKASPRDAESPLFVAASIGEDDPAGVELLLSSGADPNGFARLGRTGLMAAALQGNCAICESLLKHGANINAQDRFGSTALMEAARAGANLVLQRLVFWNPETEHIDKLERTALLIAASSKRANADTIKLLLAMGADPSKTNRDGQTALDICESANRLALAELLQDAATPKRVEIDLPGMDSETDDGSEAARSLDAKATDQPAAHDQSPSTQDLLDLPTDLGLPEPLTSDDAGDEGDLVIDLGPLGPAQTEDPPTELVAPEAEEPEAEEPEAEAPEAEAPEAEAPEAEEPDVEEPDVEAPDVEAPDVEAPDVEESDVEEPDVEEPDVEEPDVEAPDVEAPDVEEPDVEEPDVEEPDVEEPDVEEPEVDPIERASDQLVAAASAGDGEVCEQILDQQRNLPEWVLLSAFNAAIRYHHAQVAVLLLEQGVSIDSRDDENRSLLQHIIDHQPLLLEVVMALVQRGADVNERDDESTILIQTCRSAAAVEDASEYTAVIKALLHAGAKVNETDHRNRTALHWAVVNCPAAAIKALLESGASPNAVDDDGDTPLITLCRGMREDRHSIARLLLKSGADANQTAIDGHSAIHLAMSGGDTTLGKLLAVKRPPAPSKPPASSARVVKLVAPSTAEDVPIGELAANGDVVGIRRAVEAGSDVNTVDEHGCTALIRAAGAGQLKAVELLVQAGADAHRTTTNGFTALMAAASAGHADVVAYLASQGADIEHRQEFGVTPLMMAAARWNNEVIKTLIAQGADVNARDDSDSTPLMAAVQAALSRDDTDHAAEVIETLLEAGANVSAVNDDGQSALMLVLGVRAPSGVKVPGKALARLVHQLLRAGAGVDQQDLTGWSALHAAAAYGLIEPARELLVAGANQRLRDINGLSACDLAMDCGHGDIVDLLIGKR